MVSFRHRLEAGLAARGIEACYDPADPGCESILVIGGTRQIAGLWRARRNGKRIVQRLNGMNWLHKAYQERSLRHYLRSEYGNFILSLIRSRLAHHIVYQSRFSQGWWERVYGTAPGTASVVYNGVDLSIYTPDGPQERPSDRCRLLLVEGSLMGGYELGLEAAARLAAGLAQRLQKDAPALYPEGVELMIAGRAPDELRRTWEAKTRGAGGVRLAWAGQVPGERIPEIDRSAHLFYSADLHPACPNSVLEALACGLPVAAFDTGALPELVTGRAGRVAPYGGDAWRLEPPDIPALVEAALEILTDQAQFRQGARLRAEEAFGLERMLGGYLEALKL
jgi:glycosyltransferase involved in cell wall biosynthesis